jgi:hypothetical protein
MVDDMLYTIEHIIAKGVCVPFRYQADKKTGEILNIALQLPIEDARKLRAIGRRNHRTLRSMAWWILTSYIREHKEIDNADDDASRP